jgi:hypothetical protein
LGNVNPIGPQGQTGQTGATGPIGPTGIGGAPFYFQDSTPTGSNPAGSLWYDSDLGNLYIYVDDGDSQQWVTPILTIGPTGPSGHTGSTGPAGNTGATGATGGFSLVYYEEMLNTNFQRTNKTITTQNFGSNSGIAVGFYIPKRVQVNTAQIEVTGISTNPTPAEFAIYLVSNGEPTTRLHHFTFSIVATGIYQFSFTASTFFEPGIYAWALTQTIIIGYRCITAPDNIFGLTTSINANNIMISGKNSAGVGLPATYSTSSNNFALVPNCIFNITI